MTKKTTQLIENTPAPTRTGSNNMTKTEEKCLGAIENLGSTVIAPSQTKSETCNEIFGTSDRRLVLHLTRQLINVVPLRAEDPTDKPIELALVLEKAIQPKDELEALLAAQMIGVHNLAMSCLGRANYKEQTNQGIQQNLEWANKLMRTFTAQIETLNRHRGKGQQKVTVEHVTVNQGGQAMIGVVERPVGGGGTAIESENPPHAQRTRMLRK